MRNIEFTELNNSEFLNFCIANHNGQMFQQAVETINQFINKNGPFRVYLYDEDGNCFMPQTKIKGIITQIVSD